MGLNCLYRNLVGLNCPKVKLGGTRMSLPLSFFFCFKYVRVFVSTAAFALPTYFVFVHYGTSQFYLGCLFSSCFWSNPLLAFRAAPPDVRSPASTLIAPKGCGDARNAESFSHAITKNCPAVGSPPPPTPTQLGIPLLWDCTYTARSVHSYTRRLFPFFFLFLPTAQLKRPV